MDQVVRPFIFSGIHNDRSREADGVHTAIHGRRLRGITLRMHLLCSDHDEL